MREEGRCAKHCTKIVKQNLKNLPYLLLNTCTLYMHIPVHIIITKYILTSPHSLSLQNYKDTKQCKQLYEVHSSHR